MLIDERRLDTPDAPDLGPIVVTAGGGIAVGTSEDYVLTFLSPTWYRVGDIGFPLKWQVAFKDGTNVTPATAIAVALSDFYTGVSFGSATLPEEDSATAEPVYTVQVTCPVLAPGTYLATLTVAFADGQTRCYGAKIVISR